MRLKPPKVTSMKRTFLALSLLSFLSRTLPLVLQGSEPRPCPDALVSVHGNSCTMTKVTLAHLSLSLSPTGSQGAGYFSWARPTVCWVWSSLYFIKVALGHSPVIARVFQTPGWKQTPSKLSGSAKFKRWNKWIFTHYKNKINILLWHKVPEKLASKSRCDVLPVS